MGLDESAENDDGPDRKMKEERCEPQARTHKPEARSCTQELLDLDVTRTSEQLLQLLPVEGSKWREEGEPSSFTLRWNIYLVLAGLGQRGSDGDQRQPRVGGRLGANGRHHHW